MVKTNTETAHLYESYLVGVRNKPISRVPSDLINHSVSELPKYVHGM